MSIFLKLRMKTTLNWYSAFKELICITFIYLFVIFFLYDIGVKFRPPLAKTDDLYLETLLEQSGSDMNL
jgi:hypothetical protein